MQYTRIYAGPDGVSHFAEVTVELHPMRDYAPGLPVLDLSAPIPAAALTFLRAPAGTVADWHPAPRRQFVTVLTSLMEVTAGDGQTRRFGPGDVVLAEDTTGTGHITTVVGASECVLLIVVLPEPQVAA